MKKIYSLFLFVMLILGMANISSAQTWTIAVCSGGPPSATTSSTYGPMYSTASANATNRTAVIYPAAQLTGIAGFSLSSIYFNRATASGSMAGTPNFKVYLKEVSASDWGSGSPTWATEITGATLVYDGNPASIVGTSAGWKSFPFSTNFFYSGNQNLAVFMEYTNSTASTAIAWSYEYNSSCTVASNNATKYANVTTGVLPVTLTSSELRRPYLGFDGAMLPCTNPPTGGTTVATPNTNVCQGVPVVLSLTGNSAGSNMTYEWESSPTNTPFTPTSLGAPSSSSVLTINASSAMWYRAKLVCSGGTPAYSTPVQVTVAPAFAGGTYTIDPAQAASSTNFQTFTAAASAISCGISGPVIFNVAPGTYNEQVNLPYTVGATAANTVTFNGTGATLTKTLTTTGTNYATLNLDGADYITFNGLTIEALGASYGFAVHMMNGANNNSFNNCTFNASMTGSATTSGCVSMSGSAIVYSTAGSNGSNNTFTGCTANGGYFGFSFYGDAPAGNTNNKVINCSAKDQYTYAIYNIQQGGGTISNNIVERVNRVSGSLSTLYGVYLSTGCTNMLVEKNRIRKTTETSPTGTVATYGIYVSATATAGNENKVYNNLVSDLSGGGTQAGVYLSGATYVNAYHNTVSLDNAASTAGTTYGIYATGTAGVDIKNNNVSITRGGTGTKYCLYFTGVGKTSNYNNLYINSTAGTNYVGYYTTTSTGGTTLATWQAVNSSAWDANSKSENPLWVNTLTGDYASGNSLLDDKGTPVGVTTDINGASRSATVPDIGAYEFTVAGCNGNPVAGTATSTVSSSCVGGAVQLSLAGFTTGNGIGIQWESSPVGAGSWTSISGATSSSYGFTFAGAADYRATVTCSFGGGVDYSNVLTISQNPTLACYCSPNTGVTLHSTTGNYITNVTIPTTTLNNSTSAVGTGGYSLFYPSTATTTASLIQGQTYTINATTSSASYKAELWIDWDQNGTFDAGEYQAFPAATAASLSINVPLTGPTGPTGMRLRICASTTTIFGAAGACDNISNGRETEDYVITIAPVVQCNGAPGSAGTAAISNANICNSGNTTLSLSAYPTDAGLSFQWESSPIGQNSFTPISGATGTAPYVASVTASSDYRMAVTCTNTGGTTYSNTVSATVTAPQLLSTQGATRCGAGTVDLNATAAGGTVKWYNASTGGSPLYTGNTFTTPVIATTTTYYAAANAGNGSTQTSAMPATAPNVSTTTYAGIIIDVTQDLVLNSVNVFSINGGTVAVELRNSAGAIIAGPTTFPLVVGTYTTPQTLQLNFPIPTGTGYRLLATPSAALGYQGGTFPLALGNGVGNVVNGAVGSGTSTSTLNYYFYNLQTTVGCESPRVAVAANVTPAPAYTVTASPDTVCLGSSSILTASSANAYSYTWTPGGAGNSITVTPSADQKYYISGTDANSCSIYDSVTVRVKSVPASVATVAAQATLCLSGNANMSLNPSPMAGIGVQWQRNTGSGFVDIPGATAATFSDPISATTSYQAKLSCNNTLITTSTPATVTVNNPTGPTVFPGSRCDAGAVTLFALPPAGATVKWYDVQTGGIPLASGNVYTTPSISATTTYYAAAVAGGGTATVGPTSLSIGTYATWASSAQWVNFSVLAATTIQSVDMFFSGTVGAAFTITIRDATSQAAVFTYNGTIATASTTIPQVVPINASLQPGTYQINLTTNPGTYRNSTGGVYPYTAPGIISITGNTFDPAYYYMFYRWVVSSGCESARVAVNATINGASSGNGLSAGGTTVGSTQADGTTVDYMDGCADKVASVTDAAGGNVLGLTSAIVLTSPAVQVYGSQPYVPRVYDINPASSGAATVSIYALQSEFNAYNNYVTSNNLSYPLLPTSFNDAAGIANINITQYHGGAGAGTTGPGGLYNAANRELIPSANITKTWNGNYWVLTFPVTGFSGFFIHGGNGPLAIKLSDIAAANVGTRNRVDWTTATEEKNAYFTVERSVDGRNFTSLANVNAKGNASTYSYWDENPVNGINYYRLKLVEANGNSSYSKVVSAYVKATGTFAVDAYPNPASDKVTVKVYGTIDNNAAIVITDATGKLVRSVKVTGAETVVDMNGLAQGVYLIKYTDDMHTSNVRITKQ